MVSASAPRSPVLSALGSAWRWPCLSRGAGSILALFPFLSTRFLLTFSFLWSVSGFRGFLVRFFFLVCGRVPRVRSSSVRVPRFVRPCSGLPGRIPVVAVFRPRVFRPFSGRYARLRCFRVSSPAFSPKTFFRSGSGLLAGRPRWSVSGCSRSSSVVVVLALPGSGAPCARARCAGVLALSCAWCACARVCPGALVRVRSCLRARARSFVVAPAPALARALPGAGFRVVFARARGLGFSLYRQFR